MNEHTGTGVDNDVSNYNCDYGNIYKGRIDGNRRIR